MAVDHFLSPELVDDLLEFDTADFETNKEIPFYLSEDTVYIEVNVKAVSGSVYLRFTVTDGDSNTESVTSDEVTSTSWQTLTGTDRLSIDCSDLTEGEAILKVEVKGDGQRKTLYGYQT